MEKCIVCNHTVCNQEDSCSICGFVNEKLYFLSQTHYQQWIQTIVVPYRTRWQQRQELPRVQQELAALREELRRTKEAQEQLRAEFNALKERVQRSEQNSAKQTEVKRTKPVAGKLQAGETIADSWEQIFEAIDYGSHIFKYKIGDTKLLDLGEQGTVAMQIAAFNEDDRADGMGKAPITWISRQLLKTKYPMVLEQNTMAEGWEDSDLRAYLRTQIQPKLPEVIQRRLVQVRKSQKINWRQTEETADRLWIPSKEEIIGENCRYQQLVNDDMRKRCITGESEASMWWLRCAAGRDIFGCINTDGSSTNSAAANHYGVILCFCT